MKINLGYVSVPKTLDKITASSTITYSYYKNLTDEEKILKLDQVIKSNFSDLEKILYYNYQNDILFYRLTSNMIPLETHPEVNYEVYNRYSDYFYKIGLLIRKYNIRVDIHQSSFCVLNSTRDDVVASSFIMLQNAYNMFQKFNISGKIVMHVGSATYGKKAGINRFIKNFKKLPKEIQRMIIVENDDKLYNVEDVLVICEALHIPCVLDYHHHICNPSKTNIEDLLDRIFSTWKDESLKPKMHFSSPKSKKEKRAHHEYIKLDDFIIFLRLLKNKNRDVDIMIEAKAKDEAVFRLIRGLKYKNINVSGTTIII